MNLRIILALASNEATADLRQAHEDPEHLAPQPDAGARPVEDAAQRPQSGPGTAQQPGIKTVALVDDPHEPHVDHPDEQLHAKTMEWAKDICKASKYAIYLAKQHFYAQVEMTEPQAYMLAKEMMAQQAMSINATEGFTAFIEKRDPIWNDDTF